MGYRGEDLDLRTPQTWSSPGTDYPPAAEPASSSYNGQRGPYRSSPIWVDDAVLAISNHAFDVALTNRSGEVRLEHLIYALTRFDTAAEALENRGVRVTALRRDCAIVIANDILATLSPTKQPRRSEEFAEVLRVAAQVSARRNGPATIDDVVNVLVDLRGDVPGISLLQRHVGRARDITELPPPPPRYAPEPRYVEPVEPPRPRPTASYIADPNRNEPVRGYRAEPYRFDMPAVPVAPDYAPRLDAIEDTLRSLANQFNAERDLLNQTLADVSKALSISRDDGARLQSSLVDQLKSGDSKIDSRLAELGQRWSGLSDRLASVESAVAGLQGADVSAFVTAVKSGIDLTPVSQRLESIEEALLTGPEVPWKAIENGVANLEARLTHTVSGLNSEVQNTNNTFRDTLGVLVQKFDNTVAALNAERSEVAHAVAAPLADRLSVLTAAVETSDGNQFARSDAISGRIDAIEKALVAAGEAAVAARDAYVKDLNAVHEALVKLNANQHTLAGSIDQWRLDASGDLSIIANRLDKLDQENERPVELMKSLMTTSNNMNRLMIERYHRRNRFWYWLFGTDDWITASWPSQVANVENEMRGLRESSDNV